MKIFSVAFVGCLIACSAAVAAAAVDPQNKWVVMMLNCNACTALTCDMIGAQNVTGTCFRVSQKRSKCDCRAPTLDAGPCEDLTSLEECDAIYGAFCVWKSASRRCATRSFDANPIACDTHKRKKRCLAAGAARACVWKKRRCERAARAAA